MNEADTLDKAATSHSAFLRTPLYALHRELGAKIVPFAGYDMPVQYASGIVKEHSHVRARAGLFDVSHMGQAALIAPDFDSAAEALERLVPADIRGLKPGQIRYTQLLNEAGGIIDDLLVTRDEDGQGISLVVNASRKEVDFSHIAARLPKSIAIEPKPARALLALQGPQAAEILRRFVPGAGALGFMQCGRFEIRGCSAVVSRSGYTGEDGFEISVEAEDAEALARLLLAEDGVLPIGLGARDTLRLEAGLPLYGQDMDETVSPIEAGLAFSIGKRRRTQGGFLGEERIARDLTEGPKKLRIGLKLDGRAAARHGMTILDQNGNAVGEITSGSFTPTAGASIATGYVPVALSSSGTRLAVDIRGGSVPAHVTSLPFIPHRYVRKS